MYRLARAEGWIASRREFGRMTLREFDRFIVLRSERHKRECFYAGIPASAIANFAGKMLRDGNTMSPWDFVPQPYEWVRLERKRAEIRDAMVLAFYQKSAIDRSAVISSIVEDGFSEDEAETMLREMFPKWKVAK
jgi:hypothetical protein